MRNPEEEIREFLLNGELAAASRALLAAYGQEVHRYLRRMLGGRSEAEDLFHDSCEIALKKLPSLQLYEDSKVRNWFYGIARLVAYKWRRRYSRRPGKVVRFDTDQEKILAAPGWDPDLHRARQIQFVKAIQAEMTDEEREILHLRTEVGMKFKEIAELTGISLDGAKKRFQRAKDHLTVLVRELGEKVVVISPGP